MQILHLCDYAKIVGKTAKRGKTQLLPWPTLRGPPQKTIREGIALTAVGVISGILKKNTNPFLKTTLS